MVRLERDEWGLCGEASLASDDCDSKGVKGERRPGLLRNFFIACGVLTTGVIDAHCTHKLQAATSTSA